MQSPRNRVAPMSGINRSAVSNGSRLLDGIDGRSSAARRFRDLCRAYEVEVGGVLSEVERGLIKQAAALTMRAEQLQADIVNDKPVNSDELIRLTGTVRRILGTISRRAAQRKASPAPTIRDRLNARRATLAAGAPAGEAA